MGGWKNEIRTLAQDFGLNIVMVNNLIYEAEQKIKCGTQGRTTKQTRYDYVLHRLKKYVYNV
jgi:hypothetical protein